MLIGPLLYNISQYDLDLSILQTGIDIFEKVLILVRMIQILIKGMPPRLLTSSQMCDQTLADDQPLL